jgi:hypothetical protein
MTDDEELGDQARTNTIDQFRLVFDPKALDAVVARLERNEAIASTSMNNEQLRAVALGLMGQMVYERLREFAPAAEALPHPDEVTGQTQAPASP